MNESIRREIQALSKAKIEQIKADYYKNVGLTCWDISRKYGVTFSCCCYIVK